MGGFFGAVSRYLSLALTVRLFGARTFPYGTMIVNISGCFLIGLGLGLATSREVLSPETRLMVFTGFLGSYTTYSTFAYESFVLAREGGFIASMANIIFHMILGLTAVWAGDFISRLV
ncbi:MAG: fluoride efflux transporter CrcB [Proteobacteria bacterium]|nr:fluoride efflux transporter CrcB [Pseudomonadota bacterium]